MPVPSDSIDTFESAAIVGFPNTPETFLSEAYCKLFSPKTPVFSRAKGLSVENLKSGVSLDTYPNIPV
jgi:hypothetical protein